MNLTELKEMKILQLAKLAKDLNIEAPGALRKQDLIFHILQAQKSDAPIEAEGAVFDPQFHEAIEMVDTRDAKDNHVISELQRGYRLKDRLLRPAMVRVARNPGK